MSDLNYFLQGLDWIMSKNINLQEKKRQKTKLNNCLCIEGIKLWRRFVFFSSRLKKKAAEEHSDVSDKLNKEINKEINKS